MRDLLHECLTSLRSELQADWEVIVVINGDDDGTAEDVRRSFPKASVIVNDVNRGVAPARNQGCAASTGEIVILVDADTRWSPGVLAHLVDDLRQWPDVGVVGPRLVSPEGLWQRTARHFPTILTKVRRRAPAPVQSLLPDDDVADSTEPVDVGYVIGACQVIRREALEKVGFLDERIFYGPEDIDMCLRIWRAGWRVVWDPRVSVVHHQQRITKRKVTSRHTLRLLEGMTYYFWKHRYLFRAPTYGDRRHNNVGN